MDARSDRWVNVSESEFAHERAGLDHIRELLPDQPPYRAWSNFEFRDSSGKWHEVDLLVLGQRRLHLVELKHYRGVVSGNAYRWHRNGRTEDSPLLLARRKAQRLKDVLVRALNKLEPGAGRRDVPFIQESVFLHAPGSRCTLPPDQRTDLFGLDDADDSGLPSIMARLMESSDGEQRRLIRQDGSTAELFKHIGFAVRREREVGAWRLLRPAEVEGQGWQDWLAEHRLARRDQVTIRFFVAPPGSSKDDQSAERHLVEREYDLTHRLRHDGLLSPRDIVDDDLGTGLVFDRDSDARRLDLWIADLPKPLTLSEQLGLIRQLAEALDYAHGHHVVHRGLTPEAIVVTGNPARVKIADWQLAGRDAQLSQTPGTLAPGTRLFREMMPSSDALERQAGAYLAPESRWQDDVDRIRLDVFGLGAVAYFILTGRAPAEHVADLRERLLRDDGLDLSADLPEVGATLRDLILRATCPTVSRRFESTSDFRAALEAAERDAVVRTALPESDPLDAIAGSQLDERFTLIRRLGSGSTAVGLLVEDATAPGTPRVLKVARDDRAIERLEAEAIALSAVPDDQHLVRLIEPRPLVIGTRRALLLESAGEQTLAEELRTRPRLSLDRLQMWGTDLLRTLIALDRAGVDHRDIKPTNLGVRLRRGDRTKHLVLFDFSLTKAGSSDIEAGTPPYLDPFLGRGSRTRWDSAAERYAASVTLFEMATGSTPLYAADGTAAAMSDSEAVLDAGIFDPVAAAGLLDFFSRALRREATERFDTAAEMLTAWAAIFTPELTRLPADADALAAAAQVDTALSASGLSARALSALEHLALETVGDLLGAHLTNVSDFRGWADGTRKEVMGRAKQWRAKFAETTSGNVGPAATVDGADIEATARLLLARATSGKAQGRAGVISAVLGLSNSSADGGGPLDAFATQGQFGAAVGPQSAPSISQHLTAAIKQLSAEPDTAGILTSVLGQIEALVLARGGLMVASDLGASLRIADDRDSAEHHRLAAGIARLALDRADQIERNDGEPSPLSRRRRKSGTVVMATSSQLLEVADALGMRADELVRTSAGAGDRVVPVTRAAQRLRELWPADLSNPDDVTLVRLAASLSSTASASQRGELHDRRLSPVDAARIALTGLSVTETITRAEIVTRIRSRFPSVEDIPEDRRLDSILVEAGIELDWDGSVYRPRKSPTNTTGLVSATATQQHVLVDRTGDQQEDRVLAQSIQSGAFVAIGVRAGDVDRASATLRDKFDAQEIDLTAELIGALRRNGERLGVGWDDIVAADAAEPNSSADRGLARLVESSLPAVLEAVDTSIAADDRSASPVLLTEAAPLARYGYLNSLGAYADIAAHRTRAVWLLFPLDPSQSAAIDNVPLPINHGGQFLTLDRVWVESNLSTGATR